jgi:hypothetical protein
MDRVGKGAAAGQPVICWAHVQGLGQAARYLAYSSNQAAEVNNKRLKQQCNAQDGCPPMLAMPALPANPSVPHGIPIKSKPKVALIPSMLGTE